MDPYDVKVKDYEDLLVVDALLTNEDKSHSVKLSRSIANLGDQPKLIENAVVTILCDDGTKEILKEVQPGVYKTDSINFKTEIGKKYQLEIQTTNGKRYQSTECVLLPESEIKNIYYQKGSYITDNDQEVFGVDFFLDGDSEKDSYLRWMFEETWKFHTQYATLVGFNENKELIGIPPVNYFCWKNERSNQIVVHSLKNQSSTELKGKKICFVQAGENDRFNMKYSILIKQLAISQEEYNFWNKLKASTEDVDDIFGTQPFSISGNVKNVNDDKEPVLGYFQVGTVVSKRLFLDYIAVKNLGLDKVYYSETCKLDTINADGKPYTNLYDIYYDNVLNGGYGLHDALPGGGGLLLCLPECVDCTLTGSNKKPIFWED
jgi:hypothetical protein